MCHQKFGNAVKSISWQHNIDYITVSCYVQLCAACQQRPSSYRAQCQGQIVDTCYES